MRWHKSNERQTIITIDGPAGSGKSTVCKEIAKKLGLIYIDSGAIYRAIAYALWNTEQITTDCNGKWFQKITYGTLSELPLKFEAKIGSIEIYFKGNILASEIRTPEISMLTSRLSKLKPIRDFANEIQRKIASKGSSIVDGRDAATVVFPDACLKIYLTASPEIRASRRLEEYKSRGVNVTFEQVLDEIKQRDLNDTSREHAPLKIAENAVIVDTSSKTIHQVVDYIIKLAKEQC